MFEIGGCFMLFDTLSSKFIQMKNVYY